MDKIELQINQDENTVNDIAEKIELASNTNIVTKEEFLQKLSGKDVVKFKKINVDGQLFFQYEKELDESNQRIKGYEEYIGDDKFKNDASNKVFENNIKGNVNSRKHEFFKNSSFNRFISIVVIKKPELQSNKNLLWKNV